MFKKFFANLKAKRDELQEKANQQKAEYDSGKGGITLVLHNGQEIRLKAGNTLLVMNEIHKHGFNSSKKITVNGNVLPLRSISHYYQNEDEKKTL